MKSKVIHESDLIEVIVYSFLAFFLMGVVLVLFFYFSRKKIIKNELEKKDLQIFYQKELIRSVIITQEAERKRIAQDLHDDISSKLNVVSLNCHLLSTPNLLPNEIMEIKKNIISISNKALENSRKIAHGLLPPVLDKFGLDAGIEELCFEFRSCKLVDVVYDNSIVFDERDKDMQLHVFRILQELMNNSLRHGNASEIVIVFCEINGIKNCNYKDNGIGFDVLDVKNQNGLGMKNIESRIAFLNSSILVNSTVGKGVEFVFNF
jgi:signal transduction histidine kinase